MARICIRYRLDSSSTTPAHRFVIGNFRPLARITEHATFVVGRSTQGHLSLPDKDPHVSRFHMLVEINPPL